LVKVTGAVATGVLVVGGAAVLAQSGTARTSRIAQDQGGLAVAPLKVDRPAATGATDAITVSNRSKEALDVEVKARPWTQSSSTGDVAPNRRSALSGVRVDGGSFELAPGQTRTVNVTLTGAPRGGSLYGALEVVGLPADLKRRKGLVLGYRLVGALRYQPASKTYALKPSSVRVRGGKLVIPVRSTGNTNAVVSASAEVKGATGTRRGSGRAAILPGKQVNLPLMSTKTMRAGTYTVRVTLKQGTVTRKITKKIRIKR
jgi:P pilus assembly chaperone PapD